MTLWSERRRRDSLSPFRDSLDRRAALPGRFVTAALVAAIVLASFGPGGWASAAAQSPSPLQGRRVVSTTARTSYFPGNPIDFGLGLDVHQPKPLCTYAPPEIDLQYLTLDRTETGYSAAVIFFAPIRPLTELNGNPVTHVVRLTFTPPSGDPVMFKASLSKSRLTVTRGATKLTDEAAGSVAALDVDRVLFTVPGSLGIAPDWDVMASVEIQGKQPICPEFPINRRQNGTPPATVGSLTGEDPAGTVTFARHAVIYGGTDKPVFEPYETPDWSRIESLRLEQNDQDQVTVIAKMAGDLTKVPVPTEPGTYLAVAFDLAPPDFFGLNYPYSVAWYWVPGDPFPPTVNVTAPGWWNQTVGTVPVNVEGREIRFDFGGFVPNARLEDLGPPEEVPVRFGTFATSFVAHPYVESPTCVCPAAEAPPADPSDGPQQGDLLYVIFGHLLSITNQATGTAAYGWIDHDGRFLAENETEFYRGVLNLVPNQQTYDVGLDGVYVRKTAAQPDANSASTADAFRLSTSIPPDSAIQSPRFAPSPVQLQSCADDIVCVAMFLVVTWIIFVGFDGYDFEMCLLFGECEALQEALLVLQLIDAIDKELAARAATMAAQTNGMSMPPASFGNSGPVAQNSLLSATPPNGSVAFPIPPSPPFSSIAISPDYPGIPTKPTLANADWAIRAGTLYSDPALQALGVGGAYLAGPFVDSRLLLTPSPATPTTAALSAPTTLLGTVLLPTAHSTRRKQASAHRNLRA